MILEQPLPPGKEPKPCCANLRCKSMYCRADERPGLLHASETMTYWCALTNDHDGPDNALAKHDRCQSGRGCYLPPPV